MLMTNVEIIENNLKKLREEFISYLDGDENYVILFDKNKYQTFKSNKKVDEKNFDRKLALCTIIQKRDEKAHPKCDMGHKPNHEYFLIHTIYMLGSKNIISDSDFEKIYETPEFYEIQSVGYNRGHIGDKEISIKEIIEKYINGNEKIEGLDEYFTTKNSMEEIK